MRLDEVSGSAELGALFRGYFAMYAVLKREGVLPSGEVAEVLRMLVGSDDVSKELREAVETLALQLDQVDSGRPTLSVVQGGGASALPLDEAG